MKVKVCPVAGCPELCPCPTHGRRSSDPWSKHRSPQERGMQAAMRRAVLERDNHTCTRCGHHDPSGKTLQAHHRRSTTDYRPEHATTLCRPCHRAVDHWAR